MSLLVHYTLKSADDHDALVAAMRTLVADLKTEGVPVHYSCFTTDDPAKFLGTLELADDDAFKAFQTSAAFAAYRETVTPILAGPPTTDKIGGIATTRD